MKRKILVFTPSFKFKNIHFKKDVIIIPKIISRIYNLDIYILTEKNEITYNNHSEIKLIFSKWLLNNLLNFYKLKPEILFIIHITKITLVYIFLFKIINRKTKIYLKLDWESLLDIKSFIKKIAIYFFMIFPDYLSIESKRWYKFIKDNYNFFSNKFYYLPNGYDPNSYEKYSYWDKDNIIITVSRLWTYQKNTELFLKIAKDILEKLNNYKFYLIWPIEDDFKKNIEDFFLENPKLINHIIFTWEINNENELKEFYKKSKFFILTSRFDITPNVYVEAWYYWNIIVSTNVWWANDITNDNKNWCVFEEENYKEASNYIITSIKNNSIKDIWIKSTKYIQDNFKYINYIRNIFK